MDVIEGKGGVLIHIRTRGRSIHLVGFRGRPLNATVNEVVANGPPSFGKARSFEGKHCFRVRSTGNEAGEGTKRSREAL